MLVYVIFLNCMKPAHATLKVVYRLSLLILTDGGKVIACRISFVIDSLRAFVEKKKAFPPCSKRFIWSISKGPNKY